MTIEEKVGNRIRFLRKKNKMSIEDLSLESDVNRNYLSDLERGKRNPSIGVLNRIALGLKVDLKDIFDF